MTPSRHRYEYHEVKDIRELDLLPDGFDMVAISSLSAPGQRGLRACRPLQGPGRAVVMGGLHVTALPEEAGRHADAVVIGEGEPVWLQGLARCRSGSASAILSCPAPTFRWLMRPCLPSSCWIPRNTIDWSSRQPGLHSAASSAQLDLAHAPIQQKPVDKVLAEMIASLFLAATVHRFGDDKAFVNRRYWKRCSRACEAEDPLVR